MHHTLQQKMLDQNIEQVLTGKRASKINGGPNIVYVCGNGRRDRRSERNRDE
jgi:hypothetical protein